MAVADAPSRQYLNIDMKSWFCTADITNGSPLQSNMQILLQTVITAHSVLPLVSQHVTD